MKRTLVTLLLTFCIANSAMAVPHSTDVITRSEASAQGSGETHIGWSWWGDLIRQVLEHFEG